MMGANPAALEGDLGQFFLTEVLQFLALSEATGRLLIERVGERAELFVERGRPVSARTSGGAVRLGEVLLHGGAISREDLEHALEEQRTRPGERLGALLIAGGRASRDQVAHGVQEVIKRIVYGLMLWSEGRFRFLAGEPITTDDLALEVELDRMILEGLRQVDLLRAGQEISDHAH